VDGSQADNTEVRAGITRLDTEESEIWTILDSLHLKPYSEDKEFIHGLIAGLDTDRQWIEERKHMATDIRCGYPYVEGFVESLSISKDSRSQTARPVRTPLHYGVTEELFQAYEESACNGFGALKLEKTEPAKQGTTAPEWGHFLEGIMEDQQNKLVYLGITSLQRQTAPAALQGARMNTQFGIVNTDKEAQSVCNSFESLVEAADASEPQELLERRKSLATVFVHMFKLFAAEANQILDNILSLWGLEAASDYLFFFLTNGWNEAEVFMPYCPGRKESSLVSYVLRHVFGENWATVDLARDYEARMRQRDSSYCSEYPAEAEICDYFSRESIDELLGEEGSENRELFFDLVRRSLRIFIIGRMHGGVFGDTSEQEQTRLPDLPIKSYVELTGDNTVTPELLDVDGVADQLEEDDPDDLLSGNVVAEMQCLIPSVTHRAGLGPSSTRLPILLTHSQWALVGKSLHG